MTLDFRPFDTSVLLLSVHSLGFAIIVTAATTITSRLVQLHTAALNRILTNISMVYIVMII